MTYQIIRKISEGGFSEVFEIRDPVSALQETLVLKRLSAAMSALPEVRRAFTREGEILANLRHPNIVPCRRCYYDQERICLVMEKIEGEDLLSWAERNRAESQLVIDAFRQILEAVDYLHHRSTPLLHLDLKPDNILMHSSSSGVKPVLIDFGIARDVGAQGLRACTPPYAAPEQEQGGRLGCYTDVYALGQILEVLLEVLWTSLDPSRREAFRKISGRARSASRRRRFADAGEMLWAFREARTTALPPPSHLGKILPAAAGLGVIGALGLILLIGYLTRSGNQRSVLEDSGDPPAVVREQQTGTGVRPCLRSELLGHARDLEILRRKFDLCLDKALQSNHIGTMNAQYLEAKEFVEQGQLDAHTQEVMQHKLTDFRRQIDSRTSPMSIAR